MAEPVDWSLTTWQGLRRRQHQEFLALPFTEKLTALEELSDLAALFAERRRARGLPVAYPGSGAASVASDRVPKAARGPSTDG